MVDRLAGRVAIVFGGGRAEVAAYGVESIGSTCASTFAREGAMVAVVDRDQEAAERACAEVERAGGVGLALAADLLVPDQVAVAVSRVVETFGRLDVVQNTIGQTLLGGPLEISLDAWSRTVAVNLDTVFVGAQATLPHLLKTRGAMVNISSTASIRWTGYHYPAYAAAKAAVNQLTQSLALQYAPTGVRVNAVLPGLIDTPLVYRDLAGGRTVESVRAERDAKSPTGSMGTAQDVADAALFLVSPEARYVNGVALPVDGGLHARVG